MRFTPAAFFIRLATSVKTLVLALSVAAATTPSFAQETVYQEQAKLIRAPQSFARLGNDLFGDKVNLYTGSLEFIQTDVSLPGNSLLPVSVGAGFVAPQTSHLVGLSAAGAVASAAGQATGSVANAAIDKGVTNISDSDVKIDAVTTALGAAGSGVGGLVGHGVSQSTMRPIIGQTLQLAGTPTTAGMVAGSVVEGAISGAAEKPASHVSKVMNETVTKVREAIHKYVPQEK